MKRNLRVTFFAVAITVLLLIALTMNSVSAESKAKVNLGPTDAAKVKLNPSDADTVNLNYTDAAKEALNPSESMTFPTERALNELIYDDGTAEDAYAWNIAGNGFAVRFTPLSYPVDILTARICFWPDWPDSNHEEFAVYVYDDDGPGGDPGTCLGGPIYHTATAWGWCDVDISGLGITIEDGDFYILYKQLTDDPDCEGLCVDESLPQYGRSWDYEGGSWDPWWDENYMIRCVVDDDATDEWTCMVYLDGDNDLEGAAIGDFMEMSSVGSTSDVNIVVQFDRIPGYDSSYGDWTDCKRFLVTQGMTPTSANAISDLGECNMGDPNTLDAFVTWTMTEFPADKYALILWNHGDGWKSINKWVPWAADIKDAKDAGSSRGICVDDTNDDYLSLQETEQALTGKYVQLLGYDACLMHMVEVVHQVMANGGISVGSEESEPGDGWPYDTILADLTGTPTMNEDALGTVIVDRYMDSYGYTGTETQSAVDNLELPNLVAAVDNLAQALINEINGGHVAQVQQARNAAAEIYFTWSYYIDLYHFAEMVDTYVPGATAEAQAVMNSVGVAVYEEAHGSSVPNDHGLSIYFPLEEGDYLASYDNTAFAVDTLWDEFLKKYYAHSICGNMNVAPTSWSPTLNCGESDNEVVTVSASDGTVKGVTVSKVSGPTWLSLSPANLGDIASGSSKTFTITAAPPSETSGDFTYTVRVSNTCGSPSTRDVTGTIHVKHPSETVVSIEDASAPQGGTVTVPIKIAGVENMCGANIWLNYNKDVVIVDSVSDGDLVPLTHSIDNTAGITKINWDTTSGMTGEDFVFAYVTLKAVGNSGDTCLLDLDVKELYDCDLVEIPRTVVDGTFEVIPPLMEGDVTDLNVCVSLKDSTLIKFYLVDMATLTPDQLECADTNDDGEGTLKDSTAIKFWLV